MRGFQGLEDFVGGFRVREPYGGANPKEHANEQKDKQKKSDGGR
jgi:hypothetical protein